MPEVPAFLEAYIHMVNVILLAALFGGLGLALARTQLPVGSRFRTWVVVVLTVLSWIGIIYFLGRQGVFQAAVDVRVPAIPFAILVPVIVALALLFRARAIGRLIDATPLSWLVGVQVYRVLGGVFLVLWAGGDLPGQFALPAGIGDVLVGLLAVWVALIAAKGAAVARRAAYAWNVFGILDLAVAVATGFLSSPGRLQLLALDQPSYLTTAYPLVMIPAFAVPLSLILHGLCLWKLKRAAQVPEPHPRGLPART